jgi:hypothetical protein
MNHNIQFISKKVDIYIPIEESNLLAVSDKEALVRTTHLCIGACQEDIEIIAYHGIAECYNKPNKWFTEVVVTDEIGSSQNGIYADFTEEQIKQIRCQGRIKTAESSKYNMSIQLGYSGDFIKCNSYSSVTMDLLTIFSECSPDIIYLHQSIDKNDTRVAVFTHCINALRQLPADKKPKMVIGSEIWENFYYIDNNLIRECNLNNRAEKNYVNAIYNASHSIDGCQKITLTMNLVPLINDPSLSILDDTMNFIDQFKNDVKTRLSKFNTY